MQRTDITLLTQKEVDPYELLWATDDFYCSLKSFGIENLNVQYLSNGRYLTKDASSISPLTRSLADLIVRLIYRWEDYSSGRLEKHFGLDKTTLEVVLSDKNFFKPTAFGASLTDMLTVSQIWGEKNCKNESVIDVTNLVWLADFQKRVNPWGLIITVDEFYRGIKAVGIENLKVSYRNDYGKNEATLIASDLSERARGIANIIIRLIYRWDNYISGRLESRFGLETPIEALLADIDCVRPTTFGLTINGFLTVSDIIDAIAGPGCLDGVTINITTLHELVENRKAVNPKHLLSAADSLYRGIKAVGIEKLNVFYEENGKRINLPAMQLDEYTRGVSDLVVRLKYRFDDYDSERLEKRFGINTPIMFLLDDLELFNPTTYANNLGTTSVQDVINQIICK